MAMAGMGGIERSAEEADAPRRRMAKTERSRQDFVGQGRTWPLPRTMYL